MTTSKNDGAEVLENRETADFLQDKVRRNVNLDLPFDCDDDLTLLEKARAYMDSIAITWRGSKAQAKAYSLALQGKKIKWLFCLDGAVDDIIGSICCVNELFKSSTIALVAGDIADEQALSEIQTKIEKLMQKFEVSRLIVYLPEQSANFFFRELEAYLKSHKIAWRYFPLCFGRNKSRSTLSEITCGPCHAMLALKITNDGKVFPCCYAVHQPVGNLFESDAESILRLENFCSKLNLLIMALGPLRTLMLLMHSASEKLRAMLAPEDYVKISFFYEQIKNDIHNHTGWQLYTDRTMSDRQCREHGADCDSNRASINSSCDLCRLIERYDFKGIIDGLNLTAADLENSLSIYKISTSYRFVR